MDTHTAVKTVNAELMVDAAKVASTLNLPLYYFTHTPKRLRLGIPHYRLGRAIRFRLSEVAAWQAARSETNRTEDDSHA